MHCVRASKMLLHLESFLVLLFARCHERALEGVGCTPALLQQPASAVRNSLSFAVNRWCMWCEMYGGG